MDDDDAKIIRIDFRQRAAVPSAIAMRAVDSSSIAAAGYSDSRRVLRLRFVGGGIYDYAGVPPQLYAEFLAAPSKGRFVNFRIKPYYRCHEVG
jgi:hypothetical protein